MAEPKPRIDPQLHTDFLAEMRALDEFRAHLSARHPEAQVRRDDPDARRLMEAMAYFTVRSRRQLLHNMEATWLRLFSDQFAPLLSPLPAAFMLQAVVHPRRTEAALLPRGTELRLTNTEGAVASCRTLTDLRVLPVRMESASLLRDPGGQYQRIALSIAARFAHTEHVGLLRLHTRIADDYPASARFLYDLRAHLQRAHVVYDTPIDPEKTGERCAVGYGSEDSLAPAADGSSAAAATLHPLERARSFFHFPERELFLNLLVPPAPAGHPWQRLVIYLDLSADWPSQDIGVDLFQLHAVPVANVRREPAMPLTFDGTQDALAIRHPNPEQGFALRAVRGVYLAGSTGLQPLRSGTLPEAAAPAELSAPATADALSYELEERLTPLGPRPYLIVRAPTALLHPLRLHLDAEWHQPGFAEHAVVTTGQARPALRSRVLDGLQWQLLGGGRVESGSPLRRQLDGLLRVLSLSMRPVLPEAELRWLMQLLIGTGGPAAYRGFPARLQKLTWSVSPDSALRGSGLRHVYKAQLSTEPGEDEALAWHFLCWTQYVLDSWNQDSSVDLQVDAGENGLRLPLIDPTQAQEEG